MGKNMSAIVSLMYHGFYANEEELERMPPADRGYALPVSAFIKQLDLLQSTVQVISPQQLAAPGPENLPERCVLLTFDDGHASNYHYAFPLLRERGMTGMFFVTTDYIDNRSDFCTWMQLREMGEAGMLIQSHGKSHEFFSEHDDEWVQSEFAVSKQLIEDKVGKPVFAVSFPGGRYRSEIISIGKSTGYRFFYTSKIGVNSMIDFSGNGLIYRIPVKRNTDLDRFNKFIHADRRQIWIARLLSGTKDLAKGILGNRLYHFIYERLSS
jgi:peptidoglycan/xylan/chitin deacetylase (PgdA/CDA1 family)